MNPELISLIAADVDADIDDGVVRPERRDDTIARRADKFAITIVRDTFTGLAQDQVLLVALSYGSATDATNHYYAPGSDEPLMAFNQPVSGGHTDDDTLFVQNAVKAIRREFGDLPIRANRYAQPVAIDAGLELSA